MVIALYFRCVWGGCGVPFGSLLGDFLGTLGILWATFRTHSGHEKLNVST